MWFFLLTFFEGFRGLAGPKGLDGLPGERGEHCSEIEINEEVNPVCKSHIKSSNGSNVFKLIIWFIWRVKTHKDSIVSVSNQLSIFTTWLHAE